MPEIKTALPQYAPLALGYSAFYVAGAFLIYSEAEDAWLPLAVVLPISLGIVWIGAYFFRRDKRVWFGVMALILPGLVFYTLFGAALILQYFVKATSIP